MKKTITRLGIFVFALTLMVPVSFMTAPKPAHALFGIGGLGGQIVLDPTNLVKNAITSVQSKVTAVKSAITAANSIKDTILHYKLNPLAFLKGNNVIQAMVKKYVQKINTGDNGSSLIPTPDHLQQVGDKVAQAVATQLKTDGAIHSPWQTQNAQGALENYLKATGKGGLGATNPYTLDKGTECTNPEAALRGDIVNGGGLDCFFKLNKTANNPQGSAMLAQDYLNKNVHSAEQSEQKLIDQGNGFLPVRRDCTGGNSGGALSLSSISGCLGQVLTPGYIISQIGSKSATAEIDRAMQSTAYNQIIQNFITDKLFGSNGLFNLDKPSGGTGASAIDTQTEENQQASSPDSATNAASVFLETVAEQEGFLSDYLYNIQNIHTAAVSAQTKLTSGASCADADASAQVASALTLYSSPKIKAVQAKIQEFEAVIDAASNAAQSNDAKIFADAQDKYTVAIKTGLPTNLEISKASDDAADTASTDDNGNDVDSLYMTLVKITAGTCSSGT